MSTIRDPKAEPVPGSAEDPFRYGWRYVTRKRPDGGVDSEQVPLTLDDLLFPEEGDFAVLHPAHVADCFYLLSTFQYRTVGDPTAKVLCDCRVRWDVPGLKAMGPDVAVFLGAPEDWEAATLDVAETGSRPALVIEVTSPETRLKDFGIKKTLYHRAGVPLYVIVDARNDGPRRTVKFLGFRHAPGGYEPMALDDRGRLWLEPFAIWLTAAEGRVVCIDGRTGEPIADSLAALQNLDEAEARAAEAEARAAEAEARAAEVQARAAGSVAEAEARAADSAQARAEAQARADRFEARLLAMEAELRRLKGEV